MYTARVNYDNAWEIVIDPARQGFTHMPVNGVLADFLNLDPLQTLYFDPINMMNVKNNRLIADYLNTSTSFPKYRISGFNDKTIPQLEELLKAQEERMKTDLQTIQDNQELKQNMKRTREAEPSYLNIAEQARKFAKFLPNSMFSQYNMDLGWNPMKIPALPPVINNNITNIIPRAGGEKTEVDGQEQDAEVVADNNQLPQIENAEEEEEEEEPVVEDDEEEVKYDEKGRKTGPSLDANNRMDELLIKDPTIKEEIIKEINDTYYINQRVYNEDALKYVEKFKGELVFLEDGDIEGWAGANIDFQRQLINKIEKRKGLNMGGAVGFSVYDLGLDNGRNNNLNDPFNQADDEFGLTPNDEEEDEDKKEDDEETVLTPINEDDEDYDDEEENNEDDEYDEQKVDEAIKDVEDVDVDEKKIDDDYLTPTKSSQIRKLEKEIDKIEKEKIKYLIKSTKPGHSPQKKKLIEAKIADLEVNLIEKQKELEKQKQLIIQLGASNIPVYNNFSEAIKNDEAYKLKVIIKARELFHKTYPRKQFINPIASQYFNENDEARRLLRQYAYDKPGTNFNWVEGLRQVKLQVNITELIS